MDYFIIDGDDVETLESIKARLGAKRLSYDDRKVLASKLDKVIRFVESQSLRSCDETVDESEKL